MRCSRGMPLVLWRDNPEATSGVTGCPVEATRTVAAETSSASGWSGPTVAQSACRLEWRALDDAHRGAVARSAGSLSAVSNLPSALPALGSRRHYGPRASSPGTRARCRGRIQLHGSVHRCDLRGREKGGLAVGLTRKGKGTKIMALADAEGLPLAVMVSSANPSEISLVAETLKSRFLRRLPTRIIGDRGYDSDALDHQLARRGIEFIAPHRSTRPNR